MSKDCKRHIPLKNDKSLQSLCDKIRVANKHEFFKTVLVLRQSISKANLFCWDGFKSCLYLTTSKCHLFPTNLLT